ncbi:MAG: phosphate transport system protein [bacterium]|jgi:phosphate transport system protein
MSAIGLGRPRFRDQMRELERSMLEALDMSQTQLERVLDAAARRDVRLAEFVIADDERIDGRYLEVHQGVLSLLALQTPVAGDLRLVAAVLHVITNIERVGDQCANIARLLVRTTSDAPEDSEVMRRILDMGVLVSAELAQARLAFAERDVALAESLESQDEEVDRLNREVFRLAVHAGENRCLREWAIAMTLVARALERIGGGAVDIGEQAIFVTTGDFRELSSVIDDDPR